MLMGFEADMPQANDMTIHILASVAQGEAKAISDRTRAALQAAKAKGTPLGVHSWKGTGRRLEVKTVASKGNAESAVVRRRNAHRFASDISNFIWQATQAGQTSLREIAVALNERGLTTPRGGQWSATQVKRVMDQAIEQP